jgi:alcohol-forming fatty acyl-CoA reductase
VEEKLRTLPIDLFREDLGITSKQRADLTSNLNLVINCAANLDFEARLDVSVRVNVQGSLMLLKLAGESSQMECFV